MEDLLPCLPYRKRQIYTCDEHIEIRESLLQVEFWVYFIHFTRSGRPDKGRIMIDGIDISKIGTHDLRSRLVSGVL